LLLDILYQESNIVSRNSFSPQEPMKQDVRIPLLDEDDDCEDDETETQSSSSPPPLEDEVFAGPVSPADDYFMNRHHRLIFLSVEFLLWATLFYICIILEFGSAYLVCSLLYFLWRSTGTGRKRDPNALSAYSVFNPNCEAIHGTVTAEQLAREMGMSAPKYA
jgi:hypothetical protein